MQLTGISSEVDKGWVFDKGWVRHWDEANEGEASDAEDISADDDLKNLISRDCSETFRFKLTWDFCNTKVISNILK